MTGFELNTDAGNYIDLLNNDSAANLSSNQEGEGVMSALWSGGGDMRGKVESAMKSANPDGLATKATAWESASTTMSGHSTTLAGVYNTLKSSWQGDDADQALDIMKGLVATSAETSKNSSKMSGVLTNMQKDLKDCKDKWGHDNSTMGGFGNWVSGDDDRASANDYNQLIKNVNTYYERDLPHSVGTQLPQGAAPTNIMTPTTPGVNGAGGAPSVGGAGSSPHVGDPKGPQITKVDPLGDPLPGPNGTDDNGTNIPKIPPYNVGDPGPGGGTGGIGDYNPGSGYDGGGAGYGSVDPSSTLASYDGGAGMGGGGVGGAGMPGGGVGAGGGGLAGGGLAGAGAGLGAGGAGAGAGGAAGAGAGAAGAAGRGMMPMHGAGGRGNGDDDERERSTWLSEDDDVWGEDDEAPTLVT